MKATFLLVLASVLFASTLASCGEHFTVNLAPPAYPETLLPDSPFGINTAISGGEPNQDNRLRIMQNAGIKWGRQDFTWRRIEVKPGVYKWDYYDRVVDELLARGIMVLANLSYEPDWVRNKISSPEAVEAYVRFVRGAVSRYKGKVKHWQIWNEPNFGGHFWRGTPEQYANFLKAAGQAVHEIDPDAKVAGFNTAFVDLKWTEKILSLVPYDCFDILCFHPYRPPNSPEEKEDLWFRDHYSKTDAMSGYDYLTQVDKLWQLMSRFGKPKPLWVTEICWNSHIHPYGSSELRQADMLVRFYVLSIASQKVKKVFWWTLRDTGTRQYDQGDMVGLVRHDYTPKYSYYAHAVVTRMLEGKKFMGRLSEENDIYVFKFADGRNDTLVAWTTKPYAYIRVSFEKQLQHYDILGIKRVVPLNERTGAIPVPLTPSPIYLVGPKGLRVRTVPKPGW
ncbi:cellulase family glycosylhydrolase [bacterium]|nr:cellulase family glycosylhydrolase [bacterium]